MPAGSVEWMISKRWNGSTAKNTNARYGNVDCTAEQLVNHTDLHLRSLMNLGGYRESLHTIPSHPRNPPDVRRKTDMQLMHDEMMNQMVAYRQQRVAELVAESQRGTWVGSALRKNLGLSLIWLGEKLRQESRTNQPELIEHSQPQPSRAGAPC